MTFFERSPPTDIRSDMRIQYTYSDSLSYLAHLRVRAAQLHLELAIALGSLRAVHPELACGAGSAPELAVEAGRRKE